MNTRLATSALLIGIMFVGCQSPPEPSYPAACEGMDIRVEHFGGLAAVRNLASGNTFVRSEANSGVAGVYNPIQESVEWREAGVNAGIDGVWNPHLERSEWREAARSGVAGVYHPVDQEVKWMVVPNAGVDGAYNPLVEDICWVSRTNASVAVVSPFKGPSTLESSSWGSIHLERCF